MRGNQDKNRIMNSLGVGSIEHESEMTRIAKIEELIKLEKDCAKKSELDQVSFHIFQHFI